MRSRVRAVILTMVGIPLISPAVLALVGLRRGSGDGLFVLAWALLPVVAAAGASYMSPLMSGLAITHFVAVLAAALVLRATRTWSWALLMLTAVSALGILATSQVAGGVVESLQQAVNEAAGGATTPEAQQLSQAFASETQATGYLTWVSVISAMLALMLGRWWQALLYNPGGLREEMHSLRMPLPIAAAGMLLWVYCLVNEHFVFWGAVAAFPIMVAGICLIHWMVARKGWGRGPLIAMYVMLVIGALPLAGFLCGLALIDSWIDIRARSSDDR
ncbi:hypothetical protein PVT68_09735 [Microbulbifer bruguierae]|uniref:DUF2232 domain-containing protein n=1 Tax=Microbulbifer bruguierae TaxID=3029061 RepID=A0ABY8N836_9GAMM|nr:hypothetical protein [Microbulbifer bruguierae]WGL15061.1 hypothetical protein PVT68_09735 [Microbulbifer bruguierae]